MGAFTVRLDKDAHARVRVLAAFQNKSINDLISSAVARYVDCWEEKHGSIPLPPEEE